jgi:hypothetical protein
MEKNSLKRSKSSTTQFARGVKGDRTLKRDEVKLMTEKLRINNDKMRSNSFSSEASCDYVSSKFDKLMQFLFRAKMTHQNTIN